MSERDPVRIVHDQLPEAGQLDAIAAIAAITGDRARAGSRASVADWVRRYGPAECAGITCALVGSLTLRRLTGSNIAAAYGGAWGESIGYASVIIARDWLAARRAAHAAGRLAGARDAGGVATGLLTEFGPAAILDTLVVRPFAMAMGMRMIGPRSGLIAGKLAADVFFYVPVIYMYERRKRGAGGGLPRAGSWILWVKGFFAAVLLVRPGR
jgi:hypothetical protein